MPWRLVLVAEFTVGSDFVHIAQTCQRTWKELQKYIPFRRPHIHLWWDGFSGDIPITSSLSISHWNITARKMIREEAAKDTKIPDFCTFNKYTQTALKKLGRDECSAPEGYIECRIIPYAFRDCIPEDRDQVDLGLYAINYLKECSFELSSLSHLKEIICKYDSTNYLHNFHLYFLPRLLPYWNEEK